MLSCWFPFLKEKLEVIVVLAKKQARQGLLAVVGFCRLEERGLT